MVLAIFIFYETHPDHKYRKAFLFGGGLTAVIIGVVEKSSIDNIILINIPWCLALATMMNLCALIVTNLVSDASNTPRSSSQSSFRNTNDTKILS